MSRSKTLEKELRSFGSEAEFVNADVRKEDDVRALGQVLNVDGGKSH